MPYIPIAEARGFTALFGNESNPKSKVVLVRSQQGHPLAVFSGDQVALGSTDIPNSTPLIVDGKLLILYRVDYTIYDTTLLEDSIDVEVGEETDADEGSDQT